MYQEFVPIISNNEVMSGVFLMWVDSPDLSRNARPGQFVMITCAGNQDRLLRRPLSIHGVKGDSFALLFAVIGAGTEWLSQRQAGDKIDLLGPVGNGFPVNPGSRNLLLVAGGIGIAPLCYLAQKTIQNGLKVKLLAGARTACQICPEPLIPEGCETFIATEDGTAGEKGLVTTMIPRYIGEADQVFICGPLPMFKAIEKNYYSLFKDKSVQVSLEMRMGCGMGFCYACTIRTRQGLKQVCKDGPVFNLSDVIWDDIK